MLASRCQTLRARTPRTRSEPTGCAVPSARREGSTAATACYRHHSELQTAEANIQRVRSRPCHRGPAHRFRHSDYKTFLMRKSMMEGS